MTFSTGRSRVGVSVNLAGEARTFPVMFWSVRPLASVLADGFYHYEGGNGSIRNVDSWLPSPAWRGHQASLRISSYCFFGFNPGGASINMTHENPPAFIGLLVLSNHSRFPLRFLVVIQVPSRRSHEAIRANEDSSAPDAHASWWRSLASPSSSARSWGGSRRHLMAEGFQGGEADGEGMGDGSNSDICHYYFPFCISVTRALS